jgi:hypothetical protein
LVLDQIGPSVLYTTDVKNDLAAGNESGRISDGLDTSNRILLACFDASHIGNHDEIDSLASNQRFMALNPLQQLGSGE